MLGHHPKNAPDGFESIEQQVIILAVQHDQRRAVGRLKHVGSREKTRLLRVPVVVALVEPALEAAIFNLQRFFVGGIQPQFQSGDCVGIDRFVFGRVDLWQLFRFGFPPLNGASVVHDQRTFVARVEPQRQSGDGQRQAGLNRFWLRPDRSPIFSRREHECAFSRPEYVLRKAPLERVHRVVRQPVVQEIHRLIGGIVNLDPVGKVAIIVGKRCAVDWHEFTDHNALGLHLHRTKQHGENTQDWNHPATGWLGVAATQFAPPERISSRRPVWCETAASAPAGCPARPLHATVWSINRGSKGREK